MSETIEIPACQSRRGKGHTGCYCHHPEIKQDRTHGVFVSYAQCRKCDANPLVNLEVERIRIQPEQRQALAKAAPELRRRRIKPQRTSQPDHGPGTELEKLTKLLEIPQKAGCTCGQIRREMDRLGVEGCRRERDRLLKSLRKNYDLYSTTEKLSAAWNAIRTGLAWKLDQSDPMGSLFDLAVANAEAVEQGVTAPAGS